MNLDGRSARVSKTSAATARVSSAVFHTAADSVVHEFTLLGTLRLCLRSSEGNGAASSRGVVNLYARRTTVTEAGGRRRGVEAGRIGVALNRRTSVGLLRMRLISRLLLELHN